MIFGNDSYKTVILLGAGATRGAVKHVLSNHKRIKPPLNSDFFKIAETYTRAKGKNSADAKRLERLNKIFKEIIPFKGTPTMEEAFSILYVVKDFPEIYRTGSGRNRTKKPHLDVEDFLRLTFGMLFVIDGGALVPNGYDRLVSKLEKNDKIITLNYDTVLDSALARYAWSPSTGYNLTGENRKIEWQLTHKTNGNNATDVKLIKLHGSMNWYVRGDYSKLSKVFSAKPALVAAPRKNEINKYIRQIIPPIYGKIFEHEHWEHLWKKAYEELREAEVFVVIGCSLIDTDFHLRALLSRVMNYRKKNESKFNKTIFVADVKSRRKWQRVLKGRYKKTVGYPNFERFLKEELKV